MDERVPEHFFFSLIRNISNNCFFAFNTSCIPMALQICAYNLKELDAVLHVNCIFIVFFSKVQARKAFSSYLQRVQQRLLAESRTDTIPAWPDKDNDQMVINDYFPNKWTYIDLYNTGSFRIIFL